MLITRKSRRIRPPNRKMGKIKEFRKTNYKWDSELWKSVQPQRKPNSNLPKYFFTLSNWQKYRSLTTYSVGEAIVNRHLIQCCQFSRSVVSNSLQLHGLWPSRLLCPWDSPGKSTGMGCHFLFQGINPEPESLCLLCWQAGTTSTPLRPVWTLVICLQVQL